LDCRQLPTPAARARPQARRRAAPPVPIQPASAQRNPRRRVGRWRGGVHRSRPQLQQLPGTRRQAARAPGPAPPATAAPGRARRGGARGAQRADRQPRGPRAHHGGQRQAGGQREPDGGREHGGQQAGAACVPSRSPHQPGVVPEPRDDGQQRVEGLALPPRDDGDAHREDSGPGAQSRSMLHSRYASRSVSPRPRPDERERRELTTVRS